jgi:hypothetical protein
MLAIEHNETLCNVCVHRGSYKPSHVTIIMCHLFKLKSFCCIGSRYSQEQILVAYAALAILSCTNDHCILKRTRVLYIPCACLGKPLCILLHSCLCFFACYLPVQVGYFDMCAEQCITCSLACVHNI